MRASASPDPQLGCPVVACCRTRATESHSNGGRMMSSRREEPGAHGLPPAGESPTSDVVLDDVEVWEVPHQSQAPSAPRDTAPGLFTFDGPQADGQRHAPPQRGIDVTAVATLVASLPWIVGSFIVVVMILWVVTGLLSIEFLLPPLAWVWVASGAVVFVPAAEPYIARRMLGLRAPSATEAAQIDAGWRNVAARAAINPNVYSVWVDDRDQLNACVPGGRFLSVPRIITHIPARQQAALIAHELGHHLGGHAWIRLLVQWYSAPARRLFRAYAAVFRTTRRGGELAGARGAAVGCVAAALWVILGAAVVGGLITTPALRPAIVVLP